MTLDAYNQDLLSPSDPPPPIGSLLTPFRWWDALPVPGETGRFRLPNLHEWHPGDIVLFSRAVGDRDKIGGGIEQYQGRIQGLGHEHARWVHASVYVGSGLCVESLRENGVQIKLDGLGQRLSESQVRVRRLVRTGSGKPWTRQVGLDIAQQAMSYLGARYPAVPIPGRGRLGPMRRQAVFCSEMCRHALNAATYVDIMFNGQRLYKPSPAILSLSPLLEDVPVRWQRARRELDLHYI